HLSEKLGDASHHVYLKLENLHETSSFKIRGAANKMLTLSKAQQQKGVAAFSTGNHGVAVAYMAKQLDIQAVICISKRVPLDTVERGEGVGAEVVKVGFDQDEAERYAYDLEEAVGSTVIPPCDDPEIIAGQGTIGLERLHQLPGIETTIIPVPGGGSFAR